MVKYIVCLLCISQWLFSQENEATLILRDSTEFDGYAYITHTDDILFRMDLESKPDKWGPDAVRAIEFDTYDNRIVLEYVASKEFYRPKLMRVIEPGFMTLYALEELNYNRNLGTLSNTQGGGMGQWVQSVRLFVKRQDQDFLCKVKGNPKTWKKTLEKCFKGCPEISNGIQDAFLNDQSIMDLVWHYNEYCVDYSKMKGKAEQDEK